MITYTELDELVNAALDAEGSQRYLQQQDKVPAFNSAVSRAISACNWMLANRKGAEEALSELQETRICQTNFFGGLSLDSLWSNGTTLSPYQVWSVLAFYAEPDMAPAVPQVPLFPPSKSYILPSTIYMPGGANERPVQRMTAEQVAVARDNMFMSGNEMLASGPMRTYGYYIMGNRTQSDGSITGDREVVFTPRSRFHGGPKYIAMSFLRVPRSIVDTTSVIEFPQSMKRTLADWACQYISIKQGEAGIGSLQATSQQDAMTLFNFATQ